MNLIKENINAKDLKIIATEVESPKINNSELKILFSSAEDATLIDEYGKNYIDLINGKGSIILGHNDKTVVNDIKYFLDNKSNIFTGPSQHIIKLAKMIIEDLDVVDYKTTFFTTGTSACRAAAVTAQKHTGGDIILSSGYHGWDAMWDFSGQLFEPNKNGVIDFYFMPETLELLLEKYKGRVALVIISPDYIYHKPSTICKIIELAHRYNVLFCCDDVKQGYRHRQGSSLELVTQEKADLYTFSKGLANGYRISCLVGKSEVMESARELSFTSYYDVLPVAASLATLKKMRNKKGYFHLNDMGNKLIDRLRSLFIESRLPINVNGVGPIFQIVLGNPELESFFYSSALENGLLLYEGDNQTISYCFTDQVVDETVKRFENTIDMISKKFSNLKGMDITPEITFKTAWNMVDGATDVLPYEKKIKLIEELVSD